MKWFEHVINFIEKFFEPQDVNKNDEYYYIEKSQEQEYKIPDIPLFHALLSLFETLQLYIIDPFILSLQRESIENSTIEFILYWFPYIIWIIQYMSNLLMKIKGLLKNIIYHPMDRSGFLYLVENDLKKAYEMTSSKFHLHFYFIHQDEKIEKKNKLTLLQKKQHETYTKIHREALEFWMYHELILRPVYFLVSEIELVQEWILFKAINHPNQSELLLMWKRWDKRRKKLELAVKNKIFNIHHKRLNELFNLTDNELKPFEYYVYLYQTRLKRDKDIISVGTIKFNQSQNLNWIQKDILSRIVYKNDLFSFIKREHHPEFIKILAVDHPVLYQTINLYTMLKNEINTWKEKVYNIRLWYSYYVVNQLLLDDVYEKWKELNKELYDLSQGLEVSFLKQIKTDENQKKDVHTRIIQSLKNKIVRKSIKGTFFDKTLSLEKFNDMYQEKKFVINIKWNELFNLSLFYKEAHENMHASTLTRKKSYATIENFF